MKIPVSHGHLEAALRRPKGAERGAAVVCHPHSLHGGTMNTKAVFRAAQALSEVGIAALRFNFRGVGASTGTFDGGVGERDDLSAAVDWLESSYPGLPIICGGFSFGSLVALYVGAEDPRVVALLGLGLPIETYDYSFLANTRKPTLVVQGALDQYGPAAEVEKRVRAHGDYITVVGIDGADHYFNDRFDALRGAIRSYFTEGPGALVLRNAETAKRPW